MRTIAALLFLAFSTPTLAATWEVDPVHSQVGFSVTHMRVSTVRGSFGTVSGTLEYDPNAIPATTVTGTVGVTSVDTNNADRDTHLRGADFFAADQFPTMTFASKSVRNVTKSTFDLVGDLTIRGVTREVVFTVDRLSPEYTDPWGNTKAGTKATTTINRKDFGVSWNKELDQGGYLVGDDVTITLELELSRKAEEAAAAE